MNNKQKVFSIWTHVVDLIFKKEHLTFKGLEIIRNLRETMRQ